MSEINSEINESYLIPHIIHQIWIQGEAEIPAKFKDNIKKIKQTNPDYQYKLWDEIAIIQLVHQNKLWLETYYKLQYLHQKVDFAKYVILYKYGGIYLDIDSYTSKSLTSLLDDFYNYDTIVSSMNLNSVEAYFTVGKKIMLNNGVIITKINSKVMENLINDVSKSTNDCSFYNSKYACIMMTTGPQIFTKSLLKSSSTPNLVKILPYYYLEPCLRNTCDINKNTYVIHRHANSWLSDFTVELIDFYYRYKQWLLILIIIIIALLCYILYGYSS